jgi:dienelactone hydrolase
VTDLCEHTSFRETPVFFPAGRDSLFGIWTEPTGTATGVAVTMLPGAGHLTCSHRNRMYVRLARGLASKGHHVLRFDYHGVGESGGTAEGFVLDAPFTADALAAISWVESEGLRSHVLVGSCFGARTMLAAAPSVGGLRAVVLVSPPVRDFERGEESAIEWSGGQLVRRLGDRDTLRGLLDSKRREVYRRFAATKLRDVATRVRSREAVSRYTAPGFLEPLRELVARRVSVCIYYGVADGLWQHFRRACAADLGRLLDEAGALVTVETFDGALHNFDNLESQDALVTAVPRFISAALGDSYTSSILGDEERHDD